MSAPQPSLSPASRPQEPTPIPERESQGAPQEEALTQLERNIIALEKRRFRYQGSKEQAISRDLGLTPIAYYQHLNTMMDDPRVIAQAPDLMRRLRQRRDSLT